MFYELSFDYRSLTRVIYRAQWGYTLSHPLRHRHKPEIYTLNSHHRDRYPKMYRIEYELPIMCNKNVFDGKL